MRLFGRKKKSDVKKSNYDIFGGATVTRVEGGYEITWRSPNLTSVRLTSMPKPVSYTHLTLPTKA